MKVLRRSLLTGNAVWIGHERSYKAEWEAYKTACLNEINRMRQWPSMMKRRKRNILRLISEVSAKLPILGEIPPEKREALKVLAQVAENEPPRQSDFYDHIKEEKRQKRNARIRDKRWKEKYGKQ